MVLYFDIFTTVRVKSTVSVVVEKCQIVKKGSLSQSSE